MADNKNNKVSEDVMSQEQQRREKFKQLVAEGKNPYEITKFKKNRNSLEIKKKFEKLEGKKVRIAGRLMTRRIMGKASFANIQDFEGDIQIYVKRDEIGSENYSMFKKCDIGDFFGIVGTVFKTKRGEISVHVTSIELLAKSLVPLPEKFHGLKDMDLRYRQRYLDLIVNKEVKEKFQKRSAIIKEIRKYLDRKGFLEVETPILNLIAGGAAARPFVTHHNTLDLQMYLRIAPELYLKRLMVGGFEKVYEIGRVFRNEGLSPKHNPEFTLLELYQAYVDYEAMMDLTEDLIRRVANKVNGTGKVTYEGVLIDLDKPFKRCTMANLVKEETGVDFGKITSLEEARKVADRFEVSYEKRHEKGDILNLFFERFCEEKIQEPTFVIGHPVEISPLAKKSAKKPGYTERFELFILGREYANAFSELNDPIDQKERFERQARLKALGDEEATDMDHDYVRALEYGMPPTGGMGMGIDRLVMLLTDSSSIRDIILFPTMKPID